ncbi:protein yippee-like At3g08990 [Solanum verrucosum]|uniref:protein yippee-like At3g08990 n=1 Tax=Solanum verrucosum TaxID=315347 RepID=UPI0020D0E39B|nr:protein yippee-like At3g08990 [Solanum verrucosum]
MRQNLPEYNHIPFVHYLHCRRCRTRVATIQDYFPALQILGSVPAGFFTTVFSVEVAEDERYHRGIDDMTLAETYCVQCRNLVGWKIIAISQPSRSHIVGGFIMRLNEIICWNNVLLLDLLFGGNNEQAPNDQDGGADEEQDNDQNGGTNEENANRDENGGINGQVRNQDVDIVEGMGNIDLNANI